MAIDAYDVFRRGGRNLIDFLEYCVISIQMEPIFAFLVHEYRSHPTIERALALYNVFCDPRGLARLKVYHALPPRNLRLVQAIEPLQRQWEQDHASVQEENEEDVSMSRILNPGKHLFDFLVDQIETGSDNLVLTAASQFDPQLTPAQNLPGGKMTPSQIMFVEKVWQTRVRPQLVAAGFRRIGNVG